jgi:hypothetical protein
LTRYIPESRAKGNEELLLTAKINKEAIMFCKDCGFENAQSVTYCKRCGSRQMPDSIKNSQSTPTGKFLSTIGTVTMVGFALALFAMLRMSKGTSPPQYLLVISILSIVATVAIDALLVWLLLKLLKTPPAPARSPYSQEELLMNRQHYSQFPAPPIGMSSITEHTTRNFGPIPSMEQKARE